MYTAITTRFIGPTNTKGSRIGVYAGENRAYYPCGDHLNSDENHDNAVYQFCLKMQWYGHLVSGELPKSKVYVFVRLDKMHEDVLFIDNRLGLKS